MGETHKFAQKVLNTVPANIAILDADGTITQVNDNWLEFNKNNDGELSTSQPGVNYLKICENSYKETGDRKAKLAAEGIKKVIKGEEPIFELEYPCHSPNQKRWFNMRVVQLDDSYPTEVVIYHIDITNRKLTELKVESQNKELTQQIEQARRIHQTLLPKQELELTDLAAAVFYQSAERLGGDFFNFYQIDNKLIFYLADVSGHGLDGAMLNIMVQEKLNNYLSEKQLDIGPREIIEQVYKLYHKKDFPDDYFICIETGIIDLNQFELNYSNAGIHIPPIYLLAKGDLIALKTPGSPISDAIDFDIDRLKKNKLKLNSGEKIFFTTDGLIEIKGSNGIYGNGRLQQILKNNYYLDCHLLKDIIIKDINKFKTKENLTDDVTFMVLEVKKENRFNSFLESDLSLLESLKDELSEFLADKVKKVNPILMGLHEIVANAIEHGNQFNKSKQVKIELVVRENYIRLSVADEGDGFDWKNRLKEEINLQDFTDRGRGLIITQKCFDEIRFNSSGNRVNLIKFRGDNSESSEKK